MDNLKYSLKNNQFSKKRHHIFAKQNDKQSISLQVHEPKHSVTHLIDFNKSQDYYGLISSQRQVEINKSEIMPQQQQKLQTDLKFRKNQGRKISQDSQIVKIKNHELLTKNKKKLQQSMQETTADKIQQCQVTKQQLQSLKFILYNNEQRLKNLVDSINSLYRNTIQLYGKHEKKLRQLVNSRCYQIARIYRTALSQIKQKQKNIDNLEYKINMFVNTLKDSKQTLRIIKIKQECIQALQKQKQALFIQKQYRNQRFKQKDKPLNQQPIKQHEISAKQNQKLKIKTQTYNKDISFDRRISSAKQMIPANKLTSNELKNQFYTLRNDGDQSIQINQVNEHDVSSVQSMLPPTPKSCTSDSLFHKKSPFQANQLLLISNTMPVNNIEMSQEREQQYSFRKSVPNSYYEHSSDNLAKGFSNSHAYANYSKREMSFKKNQQYCKKYEHLKNTLQNILQNYEGKQIWLDNLNCLRRKNGTYLLDLQGNAVICTKQNYHRLVNDHIITSPAL